MKRGPNPQLGLAILRVVVGVVYVTHGLPKLAQGAHGTMGFLGTLGYPLPGFFAWVVTILESFGGLALILGFLVTPVSLLFILEMLTGIVLVHAEIGWYVIGPGTGGAEFSTVLVAALLTLIMAGPGLASIDGRRRGAPVVTAGDEAP
jgi:putative oxidoreductase